MVIYVFSNGTKSGFGAYVKNFEGESKIHEMILSFKLDFSQAASDPTNYEMRVGG